MTYGSRQATGVRENPFPDGMSNRPEKATGFCRASTIAAPRGSVNNMFVKALTFRGQKSEKSINVCPSLGILQ